MRTVFRIAVCLIAKSGLHQTVARELVREINDQYSDKYSTELFFLGFDDMLMAQTVENIVSQGYDLIFTIGQIFTRQALETLMEQRHEDIPLVFSAVKWPVEHGIVTSVKKTGCNATGVIREGFSPLAGAYLIEKIQRILPLKKLLIPYFLQSEGGYLGIQARYIQKYLQKAFEFTVDLAPIEDLDEYKVLIENHLQKEYDMVMYLEGCLLTGFASQLSALCQDYGVYLFGDGPESVKAGADFGYGGGNEIFAHKAIRMIRKICEQGMSPADLALTVVSNNRSYWINRRLIDRDILSKDYIKKLSREFDTNIHLLDTEPEGIRQ